MKLPNRLLQTCVSAVALLAVSGCLPSAAPAPEAPAAPKAAETPAPATPPAAPAEPGRATLHIDKRPIEEMNASATMKALPDGTGYHLSGTYGLNATLVRGVEGHWILDGTLEFPTGGYHVDEPSLMPMGDVVFGGPGNVELREATTHVMLQIPVQLPAPDAVVSQAAEVVHIKADLEASHNAQFMVLMVSG